jgi:16S rRNA (guanine966-N2)-methyltransferase
MEAAAEKNKRAAGAGSNRECPPRTGRSAARDRLAETTMAQGSKFRITGGTHRGRPLHAPANLKTRPMQGFIREALFNILADTVEGASVLDLFSGTGSIGLEALSRGAAHCAFFESYRPAYQVLLKNIRTLGLSDRAKALPVDVLKRTKLPRTGWEPFDLIFLDPPFALHDTRGGDPTVDIVQNLIKNEVITQFSHAVVQYRSTQPVPEALGPLPLDQIRPYGSVLLAFYRRGPCPPSPAP